MPTITLKGAMALWHSKAEKLKDPRGDPLLELIHEAMKSTIPEDQVAIILVDAYQSAKDAACEKLKHAVVTHATKKRGKPKKN